MQDTSSLSAVDAALCRSALYSALALGFQAPGAELLSLLASASGVEALSGLLADLDIPGVELQPLAAAPPAVEEFHRLFGHTARSLVPPFETEYGGDTLFQQPHELGDLAGFLAAFGLRRAAEGRERVDHISCECELMAFLARKEAHALQSALEEMLESTRRAERLFLRDHLGRFAPAFGERLRREDPEGFYGTLGALLKAFVAADCQRFTVSSGPENLSLRLAAPEDAVPMLCGSAGCGEECPT